MYLFFLTCEQTGFELLRGKQCAKLFNFASFFISISLFQNKPHLVSMATIPYKSARYFIDAGSDIFETVIIQFLNIN